MKPLNTKQTKTSFFVLTALYCLLTHQVIAQTTAITTPAQTSIETNAVNQNTTGSMRQWLSNSTFKTLYTESLKKSPIVNDTKWAFNDIGLANTQTFEDPNTDSWIRMSTCVSKVKKQCYERYIDVFYSPEKRVVFAYISVGSRVGWVGNTRTPTSTEQKFFNPLLTRNPLRDAMRYKK